MTGLQERDFVKTVILFQNHSRERILANKYKEGALKEFSVSSSENSRLIPQQTCAVTIKHNFFKRYYLCSDISVVLWKQRKTSNEIGSVCGGSFSFI